MNKPWQAENAISIDKAKLIIEKQFPQLKPVTIQIFGEGWDNTAFLINENYVFRFPRRKVAVPWLAKEAELLPKLIKQMPLKIPNPIFIGEPCELFDWPFSGYEILKGTTADKARLNHDERATNTIVLAEFLKAIHTLPLDNMQQFAAQAEDIERLDLANRLPQTLQMLHTIQTASYFYLITPFINYLNRLKLPPAYDHMRLLHGDMYAKHLLVSDEKKIVAVIDWGDSHISNIGLDLAIVHAFLPIENHAQFRKHYGNIDDHTWEFAFFRAIYSTAALMLYGHDVNDQDLITEAGVSFQLLLESEILNPN